MVSAVGSTGQAEITALQAAATQKRAMQGAQAASASPGKTGSGSGSLVDTKA
ncbi:MAG: hypothetical protein J7605_12335 [Variovorax sp.]|nr:hypothetical protein [Variovorax sp.]